MNFKPEHEFAIIKLNDFIENHLHDYSSKRNYDFGPDDRSNISGLSPFISHRVLFEYDIVKKILSKFPYLKVEKFVQEIFWRTYWKGWLELRPDVWNDFKMSLTTLTKDDNYFKAINGQTNIDCFNDWVNELKKYNYLHNHTRMWFASIWIFTLNLPWQLGSEFFLKHLYDADTASNTLSWKWVAGLQTKGKHYLARSDNIEKFTNKKYNNIKLNTSAPPITEGNEYLIADRNFKNFNQVNNSLIIFDTDLFIKEKIIDNYEAIYLIENSNATRNIMLSDNVVLFKSNLLKNIKSYNDKIFILSNEDIKILFNKNKKFDVIYPFIGQNLDLLNSLKNEHDLKLNVLFREEDVFCWQFSNKGFFNFKKNIPKIISMFSL